MKLTPPQNIISKSQKRFVAVSAGRRFGKSMLSINELAKNCVLPNQRCLYVAPTYRQAKSVIWDELKNQLYAKNWIKKVNESDLTITLVNGSRIFVRSSDNFDALRGNSYHYIVCDETADINPECWFSVLRPTVSDTQGKVMFIGTPKGKGNWFFDLWNNAKTEDDWESFSYKTIDGGWVTEDEIESAQRDLDPSTYRQEYEATFETAGSLVAYAFTDENIVEGGEVPKIGALHIGIDFNVSPGCAVVLRQNRDILHVIDEVIMFDSNTNEMCTEIRNRYGFKNQIFVYPDASGSQRKTSAGGLTDHIILHNAGFTVKSPKSNPTVKDSIAAVNARLCNTIKERKLFIDPRCKSLIESMNKFSYKEGTRVPDKPGGPKDQSHMFDALKYAVWQLFPLQQTMFKSSMPGNRHRTSGVRPR